MLGDDRKMVLELVYRKARDFLRVQVDAEIRFRTLQAEMLVVGRYSDLFSKDELAKASTRTDDAQKRFEYDKLMADDWKRRYDALKDFLKETD